MVPFTFLLKKKRRIKINKKINNLLISFKEIKSIKKDSFLDVLKDISLYGDFDAENISKVKTLNFTSEDYFKKEDAGWIDKNWKEWAWLFSCEKGPQIFQNIVKNDLVENNPAWRRKLAKDLKISLPTIDKWVNKFLAWGWIQKGCPNIKGKILLYVQKEHLRMIYATKLILEKNI